MQLKSIPCVAILLSGAALSLHAQLVRYAMDGSVTTPTILDPDVTAGDVTAAAGLASVQFLTGVTAEALSASSWTVGAFNPASTDYLEFVVGPVSGSLLTLTAVELDSRVSATGPLNWQLRSSLDAFSAPLGIVTSLSRGSGNWDLNQRVDLGTAFADLAAPVTLRVYGYEAGSTAGTMRTDNLEVFGSITPVPEPGAWSLLCTGGLLGWGLILRRRAGH